MTNPAALHGEPAIAVFGLDHRNRPHASRFDHGEAELAVKAANLMGMLVFWPATDEQRALVAKLPRGRIFASGKAFTPFVHDGVYKALSALAGVTARVWCVPAPEPKTTVRARWRRLRAPQPATRSPPPKRARRPGWPAPRPTSPHSRLRPSHPQPPGAVRGRRPCQ